MANNIHLSVANANLDQRNVRSITIDPSHPAWNDEIRPEPQVLPNASSLGISWVPFVHDLPDSLPEIDIPGDLRSVLNRNSEFLIAQPREICSSNDSLLTVTPDSFAASQEFLEFHSKFDYGFRYRSVCKYPAGGRRDIVEAFQESNSMLPNCCHQNRLRVKCSRNDRFIAYILRSRKSSMYDFDIPLVRTPQNDFFWRLKKVRWASLSYFSVVDKNEHEIASVERTTSGLNRRLSILKLCVKVDLSATEKLLLLTTVAYLAEVILITERSLIISVVFSLIVLLIIILCGLYDSRRI